MKYNFKGFGRNVDDLERFGGWMIWLYFCKDKLIRNKLDSIFRLNHCVKRFYFEIQIQNYNEYKLIQDDGMQELKKKIFA